ncbi:hypothetical protein WICPIJ_003676 [Wickerhamomyces pijperi]|uniref:Uncharacterized protein n=1 Tax=Wickerhamomyces pijperi TaxID=599730 RepID=A0A9P8TNL9_WICPI|nr:hypothetical protein WICPIJ_003676 [Wickerhamomyces pijperi]
MNVVFSNKSSVWLSNKFKPQPKVIKIIEMLTSFKENRSVNPERSINNPEKIQSFESTLRLTRRYELGQGSN